MKGRPHFYITGAQYGDQVMVMASIDLRQLEMEVETEYARDFFEAYAPSPRRTCTLTAESSSVVRVVATDYPTAFKNLFEQWAPEQQGQSIEGKKAIDG